MITKYFIWFIGAVVAIWIALGCSVPYRHLNEPANSLHLTPSQPIESSYHLMH